MSFAENLLEGSDEASVYSISKELKGQFEGIFTTLEKHHSKLEEGLTDHYRKVILDRLGAEASVYRDKVYNNQFSGEKAEITNQELKSFIHVALAYLDQSIRANERKDGMYHAYNLMTVEK